IRDKLVTGVQTCALPIFSPKTGKVVNLTQTREIAEQTPTWSPDGRYLAYEVKPKTSAAYEIDIYDMVMREVKHLTTNTPQDKGRSEERRVGKECRSRE